MVVCWVMVVVGSLTPPVRLLSPAPAAVFRGAAHQRTSSKDLSHENAGRFPPSSTGSLVAFLQRPAALSSRGQMAGKLHQLLQLAPSPQTHNCFNPMVLLNFSSSVGCISPLHPLPPVNCRVNFILNCTEQCTLCFTLHYTL